MNMEVHRLPRRSCDRAGPNIQGRLFGLGLSIYDLFVSPDQSDSLNPSDPKPGNIRGKFLRLDPSKLPANPPKGRNATKSSKEARDSVGVLKCWDRGVPVLAVPTSPVAQNGGSGAKQRALEAPPLRGLRAFESALGPVPWRLFALSGSKALGPKP